MSKKDKLLSLYGHVLNSLRVSDKTGDSLLSMYLVTDEGETTEIPCVIGSDKKRLALPSDDILKGNMWNEVIAFHPLSENTVKGESEIIKFLKNQITFNLTFTITNIIQTLSELASSPALQKPLSVKQSRFLELVPDLDEKSLKVITKILTTKFQELIEIYLKREGTIKDKTYRRVTVVDFPILKEFDTTGSKVFGIDCGSAKKKLQIKELFNYVINFNEDWSFGSNSDVAPYFHSVIGFYVSFAKHLNALVFKYRKYIPNSESVRVDITSDDWVDYIDDPDKLGLLKASIPALKGNAGATSNGEVEDTSEPEINAPAVKRSSISVDSILNRNQHINAEREPVPARRSVIPTRDNTQAVQTREPVRNQPNKRSVSMFEMLGSNNNRGYNNQPTYQEPSRPTRGGGLYGTSL